MLLLFIDDLRNIIGNLPGLPTKLLIRKQFGIICVSLDNFDVLLHSLMNMNIW